ncbi:MAG TPA: MFS transporter, partial [Vicinamibacterales bacterium]|nr:MFS transporter [Vicinamibacterales bacterium]
GARMTAAAWRIVLLASLGGTLEFYDFVIFGIFANDIAQALFPSTSPLVSLMASFAAFATGYLARPIGGIVLSHYGDRFGRRRVFLWSVFVMSGATLGMGLVPSHAQWGVAASTLMVILRLVQGFCLGGELPGALTYVVETAPRLAPFVCGVVFACVTSGVAVATGVSLAIRSFLPASEMVYGWRIAFIIGGLGGVLTFVLRRSLEESPEFARMRALALRQPFRELLRTHARHVVAGCALLAATACFTGLFFSHLPAYLSAVLRYDPRQAVLSQTVGVLAHAAGILLVGWIGDRIAPRLLLRAGCLLLLAFAYPFYQALVTHSMNLTAVLVLAGLCGGLTNGSFAVLLTDLFPTRIRFSGVALAFNVTFTIFSGMSPLLATTLIRETGLLASPAVLIAGAAVLGLIGSLPVARLGGNVLASTVVVAIVIATAGCRTGADARRIVQPRAPGEPSRTVTAEQATDLSHVQASAADARFMQGMIRHHAQALDMTALLPERTSRAEMRLLGERIQVSQADEINLMRGWLEVRGHSVPGPHAHHTDAMRMPGMLTAEEMNRLAETRGVAFDRLFLELMITHHEGALVMVKELFATPASAQESEVFAFASDVVADQRMEIQRMERMLKELEP